MANKEGNSTPVYLSHATFMTALSSLRSHGLPDMLDRSAWDTRSGAEQSQIWSAFRFLGFVDEDGVTQPELRRLTQTEENSDQEKAVLKEILTNKYQKVLALDLTAATPLQLAEAIGQYGATGSTRDRAVRFFLKVAEDVGIPVSERLMKGSRTRTPGSRRNKKTRRNRSAPEPPTIDPRPVSAESPMKTILLRNCGGTLTMSCTFNPLELTGDERKVVYDIVDRMIQYEEASEQ